MCVCNYLCVLVLCSVPIYIYIHGRCTMEDSTGIPPRRLKRRKEERETLRRKRQGPDPPSAPKNRGQATPAQTREFEQETCTA